ncbi:MAG: CPBP family intramembrane glutamic endopeptidase [Anaerolineae bacterium]|nr:CPBP family intramembrane metalloprotease [Thermoflexales bacterium]MDW8407593.1 CPBP family intramembrane glutamic endopeptidase [Anaerolineae bacterium]
MDNAALVLFFVLPFLAGIMLANIAERNDSLRTLQYVYLAILNVGLIGVGILLILTGVMQPLLATQQPQMPITADWYGTGAILIIGCTAALLVLLPNVRRQAARLFPIDPDSIVHTTALSMTATAVGGNFAQMVLTNSLLTAELLSELQAQGVSATFVDILVFPLLTLSVAALLSVGWMTRRSWDEVIERLGLTMPAPMHLVLAGVITAALIGLASAADQAWATLDPVGRERVGSVSAELTKNFTGLSGAFAVGLTAGIGEELFFRGAYQRRFGIVMTALVFSTFHIQYFISIATLVVFIIGLVLGWLRQRTSLTICILVHFLYNFVSVLLAGG